jgi:hypothetical protein
MQHSFQGNRTQRCPHGGQDEIKPAKKTERCKQASLPIVPRDLYEKSAVCSCESWSVFRAIDLTAAMCFGSPFGILGGHDVGYGSAPRCRILTPLPPPQPIQHCLALRKFALRKFALRKFARVLLKKHDLCRLTITRVVVLMQLLTSLI